MPSLAPSRSILRALLLRAGILWAVLRSLLTFVFLLAGPGRPNPIAVVALGAILGLIDIERRRERLLWGNLGIAIPSLGALFALVAAAGELALSSTIAVTRR